MPYSFIAALHVGDPLRGPLRPSNAAAQALLAQNRPKLPRGYYKGKRGGSWVARYFLGDGRYAESKIARADDIQDADGVGVLSFTQAQAHARRWFSEQAHKKAGVHSAAPYQVADAINNYLRWYEVHRRDIANVRYRCEALIVPSLGQKEVSKLTPLTIRMWHEGLNTRPIGHGGENGDQHAHGSGLPAPPPPPPRDRVPQRACLRAIVNLATMPNTGAKGALPQTSR